MYQLTQTDVIFRTTDAASIPPDPANSDYSAYLTWVGLGNTPEPYIPPAPQIPTSLPMAQARTILLEAGMLDAVDAFIASISDPIIRKKAQIKWEFAGSVERSDPLVAMLAQYFKLSEADLDALFSKV